MLSFFRAVEPVCRVICTAAYYDEYRRKYFPELLEKTKKLFGEKFYPDPKYQGELAEKANRLCKKYHIKNRIA